MKGFLRAAEGRKPPFLVELWEVPPTGGATLPDLAQAAGIAAYPRGVAGSFEVSPTGWVVPYEGDLGEVDVGKIVCELDPRLEYEPGVWRFDQLGQHDQPRGVQRG
jgi:hypothetical protein